MTSACLLHFDGDVATMARWIGGPHVNAHLNVSAILATLKPIVDPDIYSDVSRILTFGAPALCQAEASKENFQAYLKYGNHQSVSQNQSVFESTIIKQSKQGLILIMDPQLIHFELNAHLSPKASSTLSTNVESPAPCQTAVFVPFLAPSPSTTGPTRATNPSCISPNPSSAYASGTRIWRSLIRISIVTLVTTTSNAHSLGSSIIQTLWLCTALFRTTP
jgi:hypothetical protein